MDDQLGRTLFVADSFLGARLGSRFGLPRVGIAAAALRSVPIIFFSSGYILSIWFGFVVFWYFALIQRLCALARFQGPAMGREGVSARVWGSNWLADVEGSRVGPHQSFTQLWLGMETDYLIIGFCTFMISADYLRSSQTRNIVVSLCTVRTSIVDAVHGIGDVSLPCSEQAMHRATWCYSSPLWGAGKFVIWT